MKKIATILTVLLLSNGTFAGRLDSLEKRNLELRIDQLDSQLKEVRRDELNYQIEKDLLKETYSNNYERISLMITIILGIIGVLGYIGIRDINSIKKEYTTELARLKQLQLDISVKYQEFQTSKEQYNTELRDIIKTNEEQTKKIKILELKEKIGKLFEEKNYVSALEFCIVALELSANDLGLLYHKARIYTRTKNYADSISTYQKILQLDKENKSSLYDLAEVFLLNRQRNEYQEMISKYTSLFSEKLNGKLLELFLIVIHYQDNQGEKLREVALKNIDKTDLQTTRKRVEGWDITDMLVYMAFEPDSNEKKIAHNLLWYLDGQLNGNDFSTRTSIAI